MCLFFLSGWKHVMCVSWLRACITELKNDLRQSVYLLSLQIFSFHTPNDLTSINDFKLDYMKKMAAELLT